MPNFSFDFLHMFIHQMFDEAGFETMTEEVRNQFLPQFVAEAERRLGLAYMQTLNEAQMESFGNLFASDDVNEEAIKTFLEQNIPNYTEIAQKVLTDFKDEFKKTLAEVS